MKLRRESMNQALQHKEIMQREKLIELLKKVYINHSTEEINFFSSQLMQNLDDNCAINKFSRSHSNTLWDSSTAVLITYADGVFRTGEPSLKTLDELLNNSLLGELFKVIHILPFLRSTSDGGFAVSSYEHLDNRFGDWDDLSLLSEKYFIMADLVLNHVSSSHLWVKQFINSIEPGKNYILSPKNKLGWEKVTRPRSSSLFTKLTLKDGTKNVWTTFGPDQIDLNWHNPNILLEFINLLVRYLNHGVKWIRLDAVGFIWKEPNTTCINLEKAHIIVKILRLLLQGVDPLGVVVTETNVPENENLSYLLSGDEANIAYNFALPPLLLESLIKNKADLLNKWLSKWPEFPDKTTFLNFTASHDGIGLRPLEGLMDEDRLHDLLINIEARGGLVSHRTSENNDVKPYELNISWWSAMADIGLNSSLWQKERFLLSQLFAMGLKGVPAYYLQAILTSENDLKGFANTGQRRDINRERFHADKLISILKDEDSLVSTIIDKLNKAMKVRSRMHAFHPDSPMSVLSKDRTDLVIFSRGDKSQKTWVVHNMTSSRFNIDLPSTLKLGMDFFNYDWKECLEGTHLKDSLLLLEPYSVHWITPYKP